MADEIQSARRRKPDCAIAVSSVGPRLGAKPSRNISPERLIQGIRAGDRSILARAITLIESSHPADRELAEQIVESCRPAAADSIRVGITGAPGTGKSTLIEALGKHLIREHSQNVAVLAIDPSSQISGGSILGDRTRMSYLSSSAMAFVRPTPSRCLYGGVARRTRDAILLCEAAGFRNILVETVGVGQSEAAVRDVVDFVLLLTIPGAGDELQGIKRGIVEIADLVVVNKAEDDHLRAAERALAEIENALHLLPISASAWTPRALACSAQTGYGVPDVWSSVLDYAESTRANGWFKQVRRKQLQQSMQEILEQELMQRLRFDRALQKQISMLEKEVADGHIAAASAVREVIVQFAQRVIEDELA